MNLKILITSVIVFLYSSTASADLPKLINKLKEVTQQAQPQQAQPQQAQPQQAQPQQAQPQQAQPQQAQPQQAQPQQAQPQQINAASTREGWIAEPYQNVPKEVTDDDINLAWVNSFRRINAYTKSPQIKASYEGCKAAEVKRISENAAAIRKIAATKKLQDEKQASIKQAELIESNKNDLSNATCLFRIIRRVTITLKLDYGEKNRRYESQPLDEQYNLIQVDKVSRALNDNKFTSAFHKELSTEILTPYLKWLDVYLPNDIREMSSELKALNLELSDQTVANYKLSKTARYDEILQIMSSHILESKGNIRQGFINN